MSDAADHARRRFRRRVLMAFYVAIVAIFLFVIALLFVLPSIEWFDHTRELINVSGVDAKEVISDWPDTVEVSEVKACSMKSSSTIDSSSRWLCLKISPAAAGVWIDSKHRPESEWANEPNCEFVERTLIGPPPLQRQTGTTPEWWRPPAIRYRATEVMLWYEGYDSGVGRATYSAFDPQTEQLWIYEYAAQHDLLWDRGHAPVAQRSDIPGVEQ